MDKNYWYSKQNHKFLHNIDTFYYSVKLKEDFLRDSSDPAVIKFRNVLSVYQSKGSLVPFLVDGSKEFLQTRDGSFSRFYSFRLEAPNKFDIFIAPYVPEYKHDGLSVTSEIVVQLRSKYLWQVGATAAFERSYSVICAMCIQYGLHIVDVKENRVDYCWHTNALQNPESYFRVDKLVKMQVSQLGRDASFHYKFLANDNFENDYIAIGKRGAKCFLRIYLKTKEVVEMGYKGFFFKAWLFQGLISRYDLFCLEEAYKQRSWSYLDVARLKFALKECDLPENIASEVNAAINQKVLDYDYIQKLADSLVPRVTKVLNIEFQVMRKMSKSFELLPLRDYAREYGVSGRIYQFLDNHKIICDYLTHNTYRLVDRSTDSNKSRCKYTDFWNRLRNTKMIDAWSKRQLKLIRNYSSKLDLDLRKQKAMRAVSSVAITVTHNPEMNFFQDAAELLSIINDDDIYKLDHYKSVRSSDLIHQSKDYVRDRDHIVYSIFNTFTGECYENN